MTPPGPLPLGEGKPVLELADLERLEANALAYDWRKREWVPCFRDQLLLRVLCRTGVRVGEVVTIGVDDIDFDRAEVRILHLKERVQLYCPACGARLARSHRCCPGCAREVTQAEQRIQESRRQRVLPLDKETGELLRQFIAQGGPVLRGERLMLFGVTPRRAAQIVEDAARRAGMPPLLNPETGKPRGISPHRLRDGFATHAADMDGSLEGVRLLQEQLGHKNISTTMRYVKIAGRKQREWYSKLWAEKPAAGGGSAP